MVELLHRHKWQSKDLQRVSIVLCHWTWLQFPSTWSLHELRFQLLLLQSLFEHLQVPDDDHRWWDENVTWACCRTNIPWAISGAYWRSQSSYPRILHPQISNEVKSGKWKLYLLFVAMLRSSLYLQHLILFGENVHPCFHKDIWIKWEKKEKNFYFELSSMRPMLEFLNILERYKHRKLLE